MLDTPLRNEVTYVTMKQKLTLNIEGELIEEIKIQAVRERRSLSDLTETLYRQHIDKQKKEKGRQKPKS